MKRRRKLSDEALARIAYEAANKSLREDWPGTVFAIPTWKEWKKDARPAQQAKFRAWIEGAKAIRAALADAQPAGGAA